jgi:hypothetical protein
MCDCPQVVGVTTVEVADANSLVNFFAECFDNRAVAATKMNDRSSRSHAIYTVLINRTLVDVSEVGDKVSSGHMLTFFRIMCFCCTVAQAVHDNMLAGSRPHQALHTPCAQNPCSEYM